MMGCGAAAADSKLRRNAHDDRGDGTVGLHPVSTALCSVRGLPEGRTSVLGEGGGGI
jgi:hypothetical protein